MTPLGAFTGGEEGTRAKAPTARKEVMIADVGAMFEEY